MKIVWDKFILTKNYPTTSFNENDLKFNKKYKNFSEKDKSSI